jgi:sugar/nucleoside kinase (ribokinase family)
VDVVSPNQTELARILPNGTVGDDDDVKKAIHEVMSKYPSMDVLYKMGSKGAKYFERDPNYMDNLDKANAELYMDTYQKAVSFEEFKDKDIELVDTTGAGDSFTGAYAVAILEGKTQ